MDRRNFFKSFSSVLTKNKNEEEIFLVRPPYNSDSSLFDKECINCEDTPCITFCEEDIIKLADDKTPFLDFSNSGCTYCEECLKACPNSVLNTVEEKIIAKTEIDISKCISWDNVMCFSCKEPCLDDAIDFLGLFRPEINEKCTNCGFCIGVCPTNAITISFVGIPAHETETKEEK